ncbi:sensor histidine kinase [Nonomuraea sp. MCN248]|uniref:histidine kinase n=1 Tax=Nonomuraea corallina TaxID=2989783 RepID=A0ABT4S8V0_9ACTN|nr:sensor histidine kinase [Nonomuraea corallina]MDA0633356.1 sensor histidine kinase [Nonomuraea corallina]
MVRKFGHVLWLLVLVIVELLTLASTLLAVILTFGLGMVFVLPPQVRMIRWVAEVTRDLVRASAGIVIEPPYLPKPPPPQPQADGLYRSHRTLYKSPRMPAWNNLWNWLITDPATWRDGLWLLLDPFIKLMLLPLLILLPGRGLRLYGLWCELLLAATASSRLAGQVNRLNRVRNLAVDTQAAEMRRIERDLHDGTQARLVALGMTIGAAEQLMESDPNAARALMAKAREASAETLTELRRVIRGIHPPVLAERGLGDAVRALAIDSPLRVSVEVDLPHRPESPVEAAAYFAVSELLANAARHGGAESVEIDISGNGQNLRITVTDDGWGGADPAKGSGLSGIERRLAAFDGVMAVHSPPGGPTTVTMELPKVLPQHWAGDLPKLPRWKMITVLFLWSTAWCPLFPQGIVAGVFKLIDFEEKSWFLALYLPEPWQWPTIAFMILLGTAMFVAAVAIPAHHKEAPRAPRPLAGNMGFC